MKGLVGQVVALDMWSSDSKEGISTFSDGIRVNCSCMVSIKYNFHINFLLIGKSPSYACNTVPENQLSISDYILIGTMIRRKFSSQVES